MGLRDRIKNKLSSNKSGENTPSGESTPKSKVEYYKPGEEPKPKYRGRIDKEHTDKLHAFSFSDAWSRRKSSAAMSGVMSPGGTKSQSRRTSWMGSMRSKSVGVSEAGSETLKRTKSAAQQPETETVKESEVDDTNVANAGRSRPQTSSGKPQAPKTEADTEQRPTSNGILSLNHETPFSTEELERAMTKATLEAPGGVARDDAVGA